VRDYRLAEDGEVVSLTHRPRSNFKGHFSYFCFWYSSVLRLSGSQGLVQPEGLHKVIKFNHLFGSRARDLPACSLAHQPCPIALPDNNRQRRAHSPPTPSFTGQ
jgi:hypothetical protein